MLFLGFILSVLLTLAAYFLSSILTGLALTISVALLALIQAVILLLLFFNLAKEPHPRWNLMVLLFMLLVLVILVSGSIWIMSNLDYNLMVS